MPENRPQATLPPFLRWLFETYYDQLKLPELEGSRQFREFINSLDIRNIQLSGVSRIQAFQIIKLGYPLRRAGYAVSTSVVRVRNPESPDRPLETYYAYAYWPYHSKTPEYICVSPTYTSCDGEYRNRFIWFEQFLAGYETNSELLSPIEARLLEAIGRGEIELDTHFFPEDFHWTSRDAAIAFAHETRLCLKTLVVCIALEVEKGVQKHAPPEYIQITRILHTMCASLLDWDGATSVKLFVFRTGLVDRFTMCGQKIMPLTVREALQVGDINFAPWREAWVAQRATDLIVNGVAPTFPIYNNWTYLSGVTRDLFENRAMRARYDRSQHASAIVENLRRARNHTENLAEKDYRIGQLDAQIYETLRYAQDFVLLSELAVCMTCEDVGRTVWAFPDYVRGYPYRVSPAYTRIYANPGMQARYLFDLCYGAHVMHTHLGAIHGDLHGNNMTIFRLTETPTIKNPVIAYATQLKGACRGEADTYVFPHDGLFACLIDYSRTILGPSARPAIVAETDEVFSARFYRDQTSRALRMLHFYAPSYTEKHQKKIKGLMYTDFDALFKVMTAVDFLAIGRNYGALLKEMASRQDAPPLPGEKTTIEVAPAGIEIAAEIENRALEHLIAGLASLVEGRHPQVESLYAGDTIIPAVFADYRYPSWVRESPVEFPLDQATLVDVYNSQAPLTYSGKDYARFPPWARFEDLEQHLGDQKIANVTADRGSRPFLESRDLGEYLSVLLERVRHDINDKPAAATSSWIMD